jgi:hypothetical protein
MGEDWVHRPVGISLTRLLKDPQHLGHEPLEISSW